MRFRRVTSAVFGTLLRQLLRVGRRPGHRRRRPRPSGGRRADTCYHERARTRTRAQPRQLQPVPVGEHRHQNGNVIFSFTDLVLPGNAGFRLAIQRTLNNVRSRAAGAGAWARPSVSPPERQTPIRARCTLPDGLTLRLVPTGQSGVYMTDRQFWRVTISESEPKAEMPDGRVWYFPYGGGAAVRMADRTATWWRWCRPAD